jgi:hypothetical protein
MSNLIRIFDNIGFKFLINNDGQIQQLSEINNFNLLENHHIGYDIPYIARNNEKRIYETGIGEIIVVNGNICVNRKEIIKSSSGNKKIDFPNSGNEFFVFANQSSFDKALNNTIVINDSVRLQPVSALYIADPSSDSITVYLPPLEQSNNLIIEFKLVESKSSLLVKQENNSLVCLVNSSNNYVRLASTRQDWVVLNNTPPERLQTQSSNNDKDSFSILSSTQISNAELYWEDNTQRILIGADSASAADTIIPTSGLYPFIINNNNYSSDFIVYGSGSKNRNFFFANDGRIGLNIPTGSSPQTLFHIVNTGCSQGIRLENRSQCYPANMTLFHKPVADITADTKISQINLSAKNSAGIEKNYSRIESRAVSTTSGSEKGALDIVVISGSSEIKTVNTNTDSTTIGYSNQKLTLNNSGSSILSNSGASLVINPNNIVLNASDSIVLNTRFINTTGTISPTNIRSDNVFISNISPNSILTVGPSGKIMAGSGALSVTNGGSIRISVPENKLLSTTSDGSITGIYSLDDYFLTEQDIIWNKFPSRVASICLRQLTFSSPLSSDEFAQGDQIALSSSGNTYYRYITSLDLSAENINGLLIDEALPNADIVSVDVYSITKGGYLSIQKHTASGTVNDSSSNILSIRPLTDTVFNAGKKDINFEVYGTNEEPALLVKANTGRIAVPSGRYYNFATKRNDIFPTVILGSNGSGISNGYSSANYNYDISTDRNLFSGILSSVGTNGTPSFYGTYDQNGNAAEWVEKPNQIEFMDSEEYVAGGSYLTAHDDTIGPSGLKAIQLLPRSGCFEDVGFRVSSLYGVNDPITIANNPTGLQMVFTSVGNSQNIPDKGLYIKSISSSNVTSYTKVVVPRLGSVNNSYRISKYEVTNNQYCKFLNAVAKNNDNYSLYNTKMSTEDSGGILRISDQGYVYSSKTNMGDKPVVFVNYISVIRFINWLNNGAPLTVLDGNVDLTINTGAYRINVVGDNSFAIRKVSTAKYSLPDLHQWHKAAYYEPIDAPTMAGSSVVAVNSNEPKLLASGTNITTGQQSQVFANLTVSGWLYVDHLVVGDGSIASSPLSFTNLTDNTTTTTTDGQGNDVTTAPTSALTALYTNKGSIISISSVTCVGSGCDFNGKPLRLSDDGIDLCTDDVANPKDPTEIPWWCDSNNNGPGWFIL